MEITLEDLILLYSTGATALAGITASSILWFKDTQPARVEVKLEQALDAKMLEVYTQEVPKKRAYYNVRCHCGRFAKRVLGTESVIDCKRHGVGVNWHKVDVDWLYKPLTPTEVAIDVELAFLDMELETLPAITTPIDIVPDYVNNIDWRPSSNIRRQIQLIPQ